MKRSHIDEILSKVTKQAAAQTAVRNVLPARKKQEVEVNADDDEEDEDNGS